MMNKYHVLSGVHTIIPDILLFEKKFLQINNHLVVSARKLHYSGEFSLGMLK